MRCEAARKLFDAYLDDELSPSQRTELGAHRVQCADCRRALALLEVSGHIVSLDQEPVTLDVNFTDRLLACMDERESSWVYRGRRWIYATGLMAAAAVVLLGFFGLFDANKGRVAGKSEAGQIQSFPDDVDIPDPFLSEDAQTTDVKAADDELQHFFRQSRDNFDNKRQNIEALLEKVDLTILQKLDVLEQLNEQSSVKSPLDSEIDEAPANESDG